MPMHIPPDINTDSSDIAALLSRTRPIASPLSPATQSDILGILQREQDHAMSLLSLSPLLSGLFISYANLAAALESTPATPSPDGEEWKALQATVTSLQRENETLKSDNCEMAEKLGTAKASQDAFRSQVSYLKEANTTQQGDVRSLRAELAEARDRHDRLMADSNTERAALQTRILDLEVQRGELKETIVEQQIKISKLERQGPNSPPNPPTTNIPAEVTAAREPRNTNGHNAAGLTARIPETEERAKREEREEECFAEQIQRAAKKAVERRAEQAARERQRVTREAGREAEEAEGKDPSPVPPPVAVTIGRNQTSSSEEEIVPTPARPTPSLGRLAPGLGVPQTPQNPGLAGWWQ